MDGQGDHAREKCCCRHLISIKARLRFKGALLLSILNRFITIPRTVVLA